MALHSFRKQIGESIRSLKNGKAAGPDGLSVEFYKKFHDLISPRLQTIYKYAYEQGKLPETLNESTITLIPKVDKDLEDPGSYRAIALLNTDQKILTKILSQRLSLVINKLIHHDQTGFIPKRYSTYNLRRLFNIKIKRELTCSKFDLYFMRSYDEGLREEAPPGACIGILQSSGVKNTEPIAGVR